MLCSLRNEAIFLTDPARPGIKAERQSTHLQALCVCVLRNGSALLCYHVVLLNPDSLCPTNPPTLPSLLSPTSAPDRNPYPGHAGGRISPGG